MKRSKTILNGTEMREIEQVQGRRASKNKVIAEIGSCNRNDKKED